MKAEAVISHIKCDLVDVPEHCYLKIDFAGFGEKKTGMCYGTRTPHFVGERRFEFETELAKVLRTYVTFKLYEPNKPSIGKVKVELDTLMLCPKKHRLLLWKRGKPVGKIFFHCVMKCETLAKIQLKDISITNLPRTHRHKPFLEVSLVQQRNKPEGRYDFPNLKTKKSISWTWQDFEALRLMAGTRKLLKTNIVVDVYLHTRREPIATCAVPMAEVMEPSFAGRTAKIRKVRMKMGESGKDLQYREPCVLSMDVDASYLCKYVQMYGGHHFPGRISGAEHIMRDLPEPNLEEERPEGYEEMLESLERQLEVAHRKNKSESKHHHGHHSSKHHHGHHSRGTAGQSSIIEGVVVGRDSTAYSSTYVEATGTPIEDNDGFVKPEVLKARILNISNRRERKGLTVDTSVGSVVRASKTPVVSATAIPIVEGEVHDPSDHKRSIPSHKKWKRLPVKFGKRPFGFTLASDKKTGAYWVETVTRKQLLGVLVPGSIIYKIDGVHCGGMSYNTILTMLRTCHLPCVIKFKLAPKRCKSARNSTNACPNMTKSFEQWFDTEIHPQTVTPSPPPPPPESPMALPPGWVSHIDSNTGRLFYCNVVTNHTQWDPPAHSPMPPARMEAKGEQNPAVRFI